MTSSTYHSVSIVHSVFHKYGVNSSGYVKRGAHKNGSMVIPETAAPVVRIRFHNRFICKGVNISNYTLLIGGRI